METELAVAPAKDYLTGAAAAEHDVFLSKFGEKDRKGIARHLTNYTEKLGAAATETWCRLAHALMALAPHPAKLVAQQALQFYVPDGKYRMQVFALQILDEGGLAVYIGNILDEAVRAGILAGPNDNGGGTFYRIGKSHESLLIDSLDGQTLNPAPVCKGMTGWHRKAIRITLPADATLAQLTAAESLFALAATQWPAAA